jgi:catechol 2,3-dioxygenase-like lactoylglutathione lyase family enzyme
MLTRVDHIDLKVPNLEEVVDFFKSLGFQEVRRTDPERGSVELALPGEGQVVFEIRRDARVDKTVVDHIAFKVQDTHGDLGVLKNLGLVFDKEAFLVQHSGRTISNLRDPHGARWQLTD